MLQWIHQFPPTKIWDGSTRDFLPLHPSFPPFLLFFSFFFVELKYSKSLDKLYHVWGKMISHRPTSHCPFNSMALARFTMKTELVLSIKTFLLALEGKVIKKNTLQEGSFHDVGWEGREQTNERCLSFFSFIFIGFAGTYPFVNFSIDIIYFSSLTQQRFFSPLPPLCLGYSKFNINLIPLWKWQVPYLSLFFFKHLSHS